MKIIKLLTIAIFFLGQTIISNAQSMQVNFVDQTHTQYNLSDIVRINYQNDSIKLTLVDESTYIWSIISARSFQFFNGNVSMDKILNEINSINIQIFPNPTNDMIYVTLKSNKTEFIEIDIFDMQGRYVMSAFNGPFDEQSNPITVHTNNLRNGQYQFTFKTSKFLKTKSLIINH
jgi:hypothetical protein